MGLIAELRGRARHVIGPVLGVSAVIYFAYHAVNGERGLIAWLDLQRRIEVAEASHAKVALQRDVLENRVRLLQPESLDADLLEERARAMLNFAYEDDLVVLEQRRTR